MLTVPRVVNDRYTLEGVIGCGGMADVFRATDQVLERPVAIKALRGTTDEHERQFAAEVTALSRLTHPAIVRLFDGGTWEGRPYLVMELLEGRSLAEHIGEGPLAPAEVRRIGQRVAEALAQAHEADLVHRDIKPGNVLVTEDGAVRLTDFGIARIADETLSAAAGGLGTAAYLAPEQAAGHDVGPPADVYALGLLLLEALTGRREYEGTAAEAAVARLGRDPTVPGDLPPGWPPLLRAMTARGPAQRPTAAEVADSLRGTRPPDDLGTPPPGRRRRGHRTAPLQALPDAPRPAGVSSSWPLAAAATSLVLALGLVVAGTHDPSTAEADTPSVEAFERSQPPPRPEGPEALPLRPDEVTDWASAPGVHRAPKAHPPPAGDRARGPSRPAHAQAGGAPGDRPADRQPPGHAHGRGGRG